MALVWLVKATSWAGDIALTGAHATIAIYEQVPVHEVDIRELKRGQAELAARPAMPAEVLKDLKDFLDREKRERQ